MICDRVKFLFSPLPVLLLGAGLSFLTGCNNRSRTVSDRQLRQETAQATAKAKQQSKEVLQEARAAAANAEQKVNAITTGVQQGLKGNAPARTSRTDLNRASQSELASLPGISEAKARQIIRHRPYTSTHQLVDRGVLSEAQFEAISSDVTAE